jgi:hypothetical protein
MKFVPSVSRPCAQDWNGMTGDDKRRFCDHCQLHVHNLSAMSHAEQEALFSEHRMRRCVAYVAGNDSIGVCSDTWLQLQRLLRLWRAGLALLAILFPFGFSGCVTTHPQPPPVSDTHACKQLRELPDGKWTMGEMPYDPPLWRRIIFFWER